MAHTLWQRDGTRVLSYLPPSIMLYISGYLMSRNKNIRMSIFGQRAIGVAQNIVLNYIVQTNCIDPLIWAVAIRQRDEHKAAAFRSVWIQVSVILAIFRNRRDLTFLCFLFDKVWVFLVHNVAELAGLHLEQNQETHASTVVQQYYCFPYFMAYCT